MKILKYVIYKYILEPSFITRPSLPPRSAAHHASCLTGRLADVSSIYRACGSACSATRITGDDMVECKISMAMGTNMD
jgi:hypothetical protein